MHGTTHHPMKIHLLFLMFGTMLIAGLWFGLQPIFTDALQFPIADHTITVRNITDSSGISASWHPQNASSLPDPPISSNTVNSENTVPFVSYLKSNWMPLAKDLGLLFLLGVAAGYMFKKTGKVALFMAGLCFVTFQVAAFFNFVDIHWYVAQNLFRQATHFIEAYPLDAPEIIVANLPDTGAACGGFILGWRKG